MKNIIRLIGAALLILMVTGCAKEVRNIAKPGTTNPPPNVEIVPVDIEQNSKGFDLLDHMQGDWVGSNQIMQWQFDWFAFDYRPISPSHVFGIFEGGSMGNLLTSFFVTDFKGTRTIMARNGGVLNGIYRTSYFVLDSVSNSGGTDFYRLVDATAGTRVMWMELSFWGDSLRFNAYTSGLGQRQTPSKHMSFIGKKEYPQLAQTAATVVNFPQNEIAWDFSDGFDVQYLTEIPGSQRAYSATFLATGATNDVYALAPMAGDPWRIDQHPYLSSLEVDIEMNNQIQGKPLMVYLSSQMLTDNQGYFQFSAFNSVLHFPELSQGETRFLFTYLHPGNYYVTVIADVNGDGFPSQGDIAHVSQAITVAPESTPQLSITAITVQN